MGRPHPEELPEADMMFKGRKTQMRLFSLCCEAHRLRELTSISLAACFATLPHFSLSDGSVFSLFLLDEPLQLAEHVFRQAFKILGNSSASEARP